MAGDLRPYVRDQQMPGQFNKAIPDANTAVNVPSRDTVSACLITCLEVAQQLGGLMDDIQVKLHGPIETTKEPPVPSGINAQVFLLRSLLLDLRGRFEMLALSL